MKTLKLVTCAEDAGLNSTVNKAIRSSVKQGIVRNIGLLAAAPAIDHAAECFTDLDTDVDFGVQVCLTAEWENLRWGPVSGVSGIAGDDGTFHYRYEELLKNEPSVDEIMKEVKAQHEKLAALGFQLAYISAHDDLKTVSGLASELSSFSAANGLLFTWDLEQELSLGPLPGWPGPGEHPGTELADHLATVQSGTYVISGKPAFKTADMEYLKHPGRPRGEVLLPRNRERRMFADIEIVDYCENVGIELLRYSQLER